MMLEKLKRLRSDKLVWNDNLVWLTKTGGLVSTPLVVKACDNYYRESAILDFIFFILSQHSNIPD
jgi:hypothetical protein